LKFFCLFVIGFCICKPSKGTADTVYSIPFRADVTITIDKPLKFTNKETILIIYPLPNGNSTLQTMGKKMQVGDDWHFDIQQIKAQTGFVRAALNTNVVVAYLENSYKSWPSWKTRHIDYPQVVAKIIDTIFSVIPGKKDVYLNGHSGGGSFIFSFIQSVNKIPSFIKRISFLDSNYGYDSTYTHKIVRWLKRNPIAKLSVFAYNDSVVVYKGKPLVSPTGGTWYRSKLMISHFSKHMKFNMSATERLILFASKNKKVQFFLTPNPEGKILHTVQVEKNGFIHSVLCGTKHENKGYKYFGERAYQSFIQD
jgi:hypothetical protein